MQTFRVVILWVIAIGCGNAAEPEKIYVPDNGYVPNAGVAIKIAVAVWEPIYGAGKIAKEKPYHATLSNGVWIVEGSLRRGWSGGVALAEICQADGHILRVVHGK